MCYASYIFYVACIGAALLLILLFGIEVESGSVWTIDVVEDLSPQTAAFGIREGWRGGVI